MKKSSGFTLLELMMVIFIIGVLSAVAIPNFVKSRDKAKIAAAKDNLNTIIKGINLYYTEYGQYPVQTSMNNVSSIPILQEVLTNPDNCLQMFYENKMQEYKIPPTTSGESSPYEILVRANVGANSEGKVCWLYYSDEKDLMEIWVNP